MRQGSRLTLLEELLQAGVELGGAGGLHADEHRLQTQRQQVPHSVVHRASQVLQVLVDHAEHALLPHIGRQLHLVPELRNLRAAQGCDDS